MNPPDYEPQGTSMGRNREILTVRLDPHYRERFEAAAKAREMTLSAHVRDILYSHAERTELKNLCDVVKLLARQVRGLEAEITQLRGELAGRDSARPERG